MAGPGKRRVSVLREVRRWSRATAKAKGIKLGRGEHLVHWTAADYRVLWDLPNFRALASSAPLLNLSLDQSAGHSGRFEGLVRRFLEEPAQLRYMQLRKLR